jgi:hypothetical protein
VVLVFVCERDLGRASSRRDLPVDDLLARARDGSEAEFEQTRADRLVLLVGGGVGNVQLHEITTRIGSRFRSLQRPLLLTALPIPRTREVLR